jgi:hypothetical protein
VKHIITVHHPKNGEPKEVMDEQQLVKYDIAGVHFVLVEIYLVASNIKLPVIMKDDYIVIHDCG